MTATQQHLSFDRFPVCVLGLGLIGGSLLRDLADDGWPAFGWNRSESTVRAAVRDGYDVSADLVATLERAEAEGALVVVAVPVPALSVLFDAIRSHAPSVGITDVTSVKQEVQALAEKHGVADRFVGGHPMAGTAQSGWRATKNDLYRGAVWVVGYDAVDAESGSGGGAGAGAPSELWLQTWTRVVQMAEAVGAAVIPTIARRHDRAVARISHLPHVFAEVLAVTGDEGGPLSLALAASSFRDTTRVAGTDPSLVRAMLENNREALLVALDSAMEMLQDARAELAAPEGDLIRLTDEGHAARRRFEARAGFKTSRRAALPDGVAADSEEGKHAAALAALGLGGGGVAAGVSSPASGSASVPPVSDPASSSADASAPGSSLDAAPPRVTTDAAGAGIDAGSSTVGDPSPAQAAFYSGAGAKMAHSTRPIIRVSPGSKGWVDQIRSAESIGAQIAIF